jgi:Holliday junction resolvase RusA-like endonuclease
MDNNQDFKSVKFYFDIEAKPKQSVRQGRHIKTGKIIFHKDAKVKKYDDILDVLVKQQLKKQITLEGPVLYIARYYFKLPKSYKKRYHDAVRQGFKVYKMTKADLDSNLNKGIIDVIAPHIMSDDSHIAKLDVEKLWSDRNYFVCEFRELQEIVNN